MRVPPFFSNNHARLPGAAYVALLSFTLLFAVTTAGRRVSFELAPRTFSECQGPNIIAHVSWDATSRARTGVKIFVHKAGNRPKLWLEGAPYGLADTGKWIADGSTLELTDQKGRLLARRTMETTPCKRG